MEKIPPVWSDERIRAFAAETMEGEGYTPTDRSLVQEMLKMVRDEYEIELEAHRSELEDLIALYRVPEKKPIEYTGEGVSVRELMQLLKAQTELTQLIIKNFISQERK